MNLSSLFKELAEKIDTLPSHPDVCALCIISDGNTVSALIEGSPRSTVQLLVSMADQHKDFVKILQVAAAIAKADQEESEMEGMQVIRTSGPKNGKEYIN